MEAGKSGDTARALPAPQMWIVVDGFLELVVGRVGHVVAQHVEDELLLGARGILCLQPCPLVGLRLLDELEHQLLVHRQRAVKLVGLPLSIALQGYELSDQVLLDHFLAMDGVWRESVGRHWRMCSIPNTDCAGRLFSSTCSNQIRAASPSLRVI